MPRRPRPFSAALAVFACLLVACPSAPHADPGGEAPSPAGPKAKGKSPDALGLPTPYDLTYGVYLNGAKVGWMRSQLQVGDRVTFRIELNARVTGMGRESEIKLQEWRAFDASSGDLAELFFEQEAVTGTVTVRGQSSGEQLQLEITAGEATRRKRVPVQETLEDALAVARLVAHPKIGATQSAEHFDASVQRTLRVEHRVAALETRVFGGVDTRTIKVESRYPETDILETTWLDATGKALETRIGGYFVARLEPPEVAKRREFQHDLLVSSAVRTPRPIPDAQTRDRLQVTFSGFGKTLPPESPTQKVSQKGQDVLLSLSRAAALPETPLAGEAGTADKSMAEFLEPTPFIQSDAPEIRVAAIKAVGNAATFSRAVVRLVGFVRHHIADEYVPAYSNALEAYKSKRGDCSEHSILFVAMARAVGIPARVAVGIAYSPAVDGFGWHAWAEVHAAGRWYSTDPMWGQPVADATHIKLADGGPLQQVRIIMLLGKLKVVSF